MTQVDAILTHLQTVGPITPIDALRDYGCFRLAARIADIRKMGITVETEIVDAGDKRFAKYSIAEETQ